MVYLFPFMLGYGSMEYGAMKYSKVQAPLWEKIIESIGKSR